MPANGTGPAPVNDAPAGSVSDCSTASSNGGSGSGAFAASAGASAASSEPASSASSAGGNKAGLYLENVRKQLDRQMDRVRDRPHLAAWLYACTGVTLPHPVYDDRHDMPRVVEPEQKATGKLLPLRCPLCAEEKLDQSESCWNEQCPLSPIYEGYFQAAEADDQAATPMDQDQPVPPTTRPSKALACHPVLTSACHYTLHAPIKVIERRKRKREASTENVGPDESTQLDAATYRWQWRPTDPSAPPNQAFPHPEAQPQLLPLPPQQRAPPPQATLVTAPPPPGPAPSPPQAHPNPPAAAASAPALPSEKASASVTAPTAAASAAADAASTENAQSLLQPSTDAVLAPAAVPKANTAVEAASSAPAETSAEAPTQQAPLEAALNPVALEAALSPVPTPTPTPAPEAASAAPPSPLPQPPPADEDKAPSPASVEASAQATSMDVDGVPAALPRSFAPLLATHP